MNSFDFTPSIRKIDGIVIVFRDKYTIIISDGRKPVSFHRWFERHRFDYSRFWKPFYQALHRRKHLTMSDCYVLADRYQIPSQSYTGEISALIQELSGN